MEKPTAAQSGNKSVWEDVGALTEYIKDVSGYNQEILTDIVGKQTKTPAAAQDPNQDPLNVTDTMLGVYQSIFTNPQNVMRSQFKMWEDYARLAENMSKKALGQKTDPTVAPDLADRRFSHPAWSENHALDFIKQSYLIMSQHARDMVADAPDIDEHKRKKALFYTEQFLAAMAPTNFPTTNPEVMEEALKSKGENFLRGYKNLLEDMERGEGELEMKQADLDFFKVGKNIATTPGKVVYQNDLIQLIQYAPATAEVDERPLLIFPPWINKFYILDLQPENSLVSWLTEQGKTVFVVSWVNPDKKLAHKTFEDYMFEGIYAAVDAVEQATGFKGVDTIGYCIGGTLLSIALGHMAEKGDDRIKSATFFTAQMDFEEAGDLLLFVDEEQIQNIEKQIDAAGGIFEASSMSRTFNMLRPVDLIWSVYVDNYLLGKEAKRFDLLYWNSDATDMPKEVYLFYLREFYQHNRLSKKELVIDGVTIDLKKVTIPVFMQSGEKDHIAPFRSIYRSAQLYGGPVTFMLAGSGHIAGVINHPTKKKYHYRTNETLPDTVEGWMGVAEKHDYSWWPYWHKWLGGVGTGRKVPARIPGDGALTPIEDAPGSYVLVQSD
ncbi:alpha/beta hydrolase [Parvularcula sp. IMCC14364]|uniref:PHA/PHB synthase family protein n=1 Tax=Parvularcula sp. IMCC14364 TaxID=3067902 RepID=UPI002741D8F3|nr:class I poly(R)-hydroxyalkanoic acid synthase [Parvularcula sp. IMCC14364]